MMADSHAVMAVVMGGVSPGLNLRWRTLYWHSVASIVELGRMCADYVRNSGFCTM